MLKEMHAVLPASDLARARKWYHDMLGLDPAEEHEEGRLLTYRVDGSAFDIYETENAGSAKNTQLCFGTDDLSGEMRMMRERGIVFEEFEIPGVMKTENGVVTDDESMTAWFRDSEGNFICVSQRMMADAMGSSSGASMESGMAGSSMGSAMGSGMGGSSSMGSSSMGSSSMGSDMGGSSSMSSDMGSGADGDRMTGDPGRM